MAKDPAVLFYTSDFIAGTLTLTHEQRGQYITLICALHQCGRLTFDEIKNILHCEPDAKVLKKFKIDDEGRFYNERLEVETEKRKEFTRSRRKSLAIDNGDQVHIYLMHSTSQNLTKIGSSKYPQLRLTEVKKYAPDAEIIWVSPRLVDRINEKKLHDEFSEKRRRYDWFKLSEEDLEKIKNLETFRTENRNENINEVSSNLSFEKSEKLFFTPNESEVADYCSERGNNVDAQAFIAYYESNGWKVGKNKMKDWRAAVRTWEKNSFNSTQNIRTTQGKGIERLKSLMISGGDCEQS